MWLGKTNSRLSRRIALATVVVGTVVAGTLCATHPAAYAAALASVESAVTCATSSACVSGTNTSSGPGVSGTSSSGYGVSGTSKSNDGVKAISTSSNGVSASSTSSFGVKGVSYSSYGLYGSTSYGSAAIFGSAGGGSTGVYGLSGYGDGVNGISNGSGDGVYGYSASGTGIVGYAAASTGTGIYGYTSGSGSGVYAQSAAGSGLYATSNTGVGLYANSSSGYGLQSHTSTGPEALTAFNDGGNGSDIRGHYIGMIGRAPASGGYPLVLTDSNGNDLFQVDGAGNVAFTGQLQTLAIRAGGAVQSYSSTTTEPVVEDFGTAQLNAGAASVALDPTFAGSIDMSVPYRVFITPDGDTHGLFVALKTARGFIVRESQGGRSSISFDYRIVASAQGQAGKRMAVVNAATMARAPITALRPPSVSQPALPVGFPKK
jgi:hypothetical protein